MSEAAIWPQEIRLKRAEKLLIVAFEDGTRYELPAEYLRVESPSAEVTGHGPGQEAIVPGKRQVAISGLESVGNYAIRILFDDGHSTGIYSWAYLAKLGRERESLWAKYLAQLAAKNLSRD